MCGVDFLANRYARKRLIDMHSIELFAIGAETDDVIVCHDLANLGTDASLLDLEKTKQAVAIEYCAPSKTVLGRRTSWVSL